MCFFSPFRGPENILSVDIRFRISSCMRYISESGKSYIGHKKLRKTMFTKYSICTIVYFSLGNAIPALLHICQIAWPLANPEQLYRGFGYRNDMASWQSPFSDTGRWLDWICLTTTHVLQDVLAVFFCDTNNDIPFAHNNRFSCRII